MSRAKRRAKADLAALEEQIRFAEAFGHPPAEGGDVPALEQPYILGSESRDAADCIAPAVLEEIMQSRTTPIENPVTITVSNPSSSGLRLFQALERSSFLRLAAMPYTPPGSDKPFVIVTNGRRMWTADPINFEPVLVPLSQGFEQLSIQDNWSPLVGTEKGLKLA